MNRRNPSWAAWPERPAPKPEASAKGLLAALLERQSWYYDPPGAANVLVLAHDRLRLALERNDLAAIRAAMDAARAALQQCPPGPGPRTVA